MLDDAVVARACLALVREVASRLRDCDAVAAIARGAEAQTTLPGSVNWQPYAVGQGDAGLAISCGYLDACFPGEEWDRTAHRYLERAIEHADRVRSIGLYSGWSGLAFATWYLSRCGSRYRSLLAHADERLLAAIAALPPLERLDGMPVADLDVISGLSGVAAYLMARRDDARLRRAGDGVVASLVALTVEAEVPRWHTPPPMQVDKSMAARYPGGVLNCGLAHGIPGPLSAMAIAHEQGCRIPGLPASIRRVAEWLIAHRCDDAWGPNWPAAVALDGSVKSEPSRAAWCYGSPGVARALWLAGRAVGVTSWCDLAVQAMEAVYRRPILQRRINGAPICHGVAGLLQITLRFAHDSGYPQFGEAASSQVQQLLALYQPEAPLAFRSDDGAGAKVDRAGLLDGAPGVLLVLAAAATDVAPAWDRLFLLS